MGALTEQIESFERGRANYLSRRAFQKDAHNWTAGRYSLLRDALEKCLTARTLGAFVIAFVAANLIIISTGVIQSIYGVSMPHFSHQPQFVIMDTDLLDEAEDYLFSIGVTREILDEITLLFLPMFLAQQNFAFFDYSLPLDAQDRFNLQDALAWMYADGKDDV